MKRTLDLTLTFVASLIATGLAFNGMLHVAEDSLHLPAPWNFALGGFLEITLLVSALRARRHMQEHGRVGKDGVAVWVIAIASGLISAWEATDGPAAAVRFLAPCVAAWLWHQGLTPERPSAARAEVSWKWTPQRVAIALGLAEGSARSVAEVDRDKWLRKFVALRLLSAPTGSRMKRWRWERATLSAVRQGIVDEQFTKDLESKLRLARELSGKPRKEVRESARESEVAQSAERSRLSTPPPRVSRTARSQQSPGAAQLQQWLQGEQDAGRSVTGLSEAQLGEKFGISPARAGQIRRKFNENQPDARLPRAS